MQGVDKNPWSCKAPENIQQWLVFKEYYNFKFSFKQDLDFFFSWS